MYKGTFTAAKLTKLVLLWTSLTGLLALSACVDAKDGQVGSQTHSDTAAAFPTGGEDPKTTDPKAEDAKCVMASNASCKTLNPNGVTASKDDPKKPAPVVTVENPNKKPGSDVVVVDDPEAAKKAAEVEAAKVASAAAAAAKSKIVVVIPPGSETQPAKQATTQPAANSQTTTQAQQPAKQAPPVADKAETPAAQTEPIKTNQDDSDEPESTSISNPSALKTAPEVTPAVEKPVKVNLAEDDLSRGLGSQMDPADVEFAKNILSAKMSIRSDINEVWLRIALRAPDKSRKMVELAGSISPEGTFACKLVMRFSDSLKENDSEHIECKDVGAKLGATVDVTCFDEVKKCTIAAIKIEATEPKEGKKPKAFVIYRSERVSISSKDIAGTAKNKKNSPTLLRWNQLLNDVDPSGPKIKYARLQTIEKVGVRANFVLSVHIADKGAKSIAAISGPMAIIDDGSTKRLELPIKNFHYFHELENVAPTATELIQGDGKTTGLKKVELNYNFGSRFKFLSLEIFVNNPADIEEKFELSVSPYIPIIKESTPTVAPKGISSEPVVPAAPEAEPPQKPAAPTPAVAPAQPITHSI